MAAFSLGDFLNFVNLGITFTVFSNKEGPISNLNLCKLCTSIAFCLLLFNFICSIFKHAAAHGGSFVDLSITSTSHRLPSIVVSLVYLVLSCLLLSDFLAMKLHALHEGIKGEEAEEER